MSDAPALRPYQTDLIASVRTALRTHRRVLLTSPTGSGKGLMIAYMIRSAVERGLTCWLVCHRRELLDQLSASLWSMDVPHGVIAGGRTGTSEPVQVGTVQTLARRMDTLRPPNLLCYDEAHHAVSPTSRAVLDRCENSWVIGLTATPERLDGRGLGDIFQALVLGPSVAELIAAGYLAKYRLIGPPAPVDMSSVHVRHGDYVTADLEAVVDQSAVTGDAVLHYQRFVAPRSCLVFCVSRAHAHHVEEAYRAAGVNALYVGGDTPADERRAAVRDFKAGTLPVITSVEIFSEGVDSPGLRAVQLLRPTQSLGLYMQQVGRGLRIEPGKDHCVILDHTGGCYRHGLVDTERTWTLEGARRRKKGETGPALRSCPQCFGIYLAGLRACPSCGAVAVVRPQMPELVEGELAEIDLEALRKAKRKEEGRAKTLADLVALAKARKYKPGWVGVRWAARTGMPQHKAHAEVQRLWREA